MSPGLTYIIFGAANFFNTQPVSNNSDSIPNTIEVALQHQATRYGYTYKPGVGTYKVHTAPLSWNLARRSCLEEGGHLVIINSDAEANTIAKVLRELNSMWGYIGFHELYQEGDWTTVHGESLSSTGYEKWHAGQPNNHNNRDHCGGLMADGTLTIERCDHHAHFICELPHVQPVVIQHQTCPESTPPPVLINGV